MLNDRYFKYLCDRVRTDKSYENLLDILFDTEFFGLIPNDDNRATDGMYLRDDYCNEEGQHALSLSEKNAPCSVLEMLMGLSLRLEIETIQSKWEKPPSEWFWILIDNLGLRDLDDDSWVSGESDKIVRTTLENWLNRRYLPSGEGGLFPLSVSLRDQRRIEIWYQMSAYVLENYPM